MNRTRIAATAFVLFLSTAQWLTLLNPLRYYLAVLRGIFLKGIGARVLWPQMAALLLLGGATLAVATRRFRKTLS